MTFIEELDLTGKTVLFRAQYNVPLQDGQIKDDFRIEAMNETLKYLADNQEKRW